MEKYARFVCITMFLLPVLYFFLLTFLSDLFLSYFSLEPYNSPFFYDLFDMFRSVLGHVWDIFGTCSGSFGDIWETFLGNFGGILWRTSVACVGCKMHKRITHSHCYAFWLQSSAYKIFQNNSKKS